MCIFFALAVTELSTMSNIALSNVYPIFLIPASNLTIGSSLGLSSLIIRYPFFPATLSQIMHPL